MNTPRTHLCTAMSKGMPCKRIAAWLAPTFYGTSMVYLCKSCVHQHGARGWRSRATAV